MLQTGGDAVGRFARTLGIGARRVLLGILVLWFLVPVLAVVGFLGWGAVAAEGSWRVAFSAGLALVILVAWRWLARLRRERAEPNASSPN
jgi:hypothetical protein